MVQTLLKDYGIRDFENKCQNYPTNGQEWEEEQDYYKKMYNAVHSSVESGIVKNTFVDQINKSFLTDDVEKGYTTGTLMQLRFIYLISPLSDEDKNELLTRLAYLAMKVGGAFGPHGKLY